MVEAQENAPLTDVCSRLGDFLSSTSIVIVHKKYKMYVETFRLVKISNSASAHRLLKVFHCKDGKGRPHPVGTGEKGEDVVFLIFTLR